MSLGNIVLLIIIAGLLRLIYTMGSENERLKALDGTRRHAYTAMAATSLGKDRQIQEYAQQIRLREQHIDRLEARLRQAYRALGEDPDLAQARDRFMERTGQQLTDE